MQEKLSLDPNPLRASSVIVHVFRMSSVPKSQIPTLSQIRALFLKSRSFRALILAICGFFSRDEDGERSIHAPIWTGDDVLSLSMVQFPVFALISFRFWGILCCLFSVICCSFLEGFDWCGGELDLGFLHWVSVLIVWIRVFGIDLLGIVIFRSGDMDQALLLFLLLCYVNF